MILAAFILIHSWYPIGCCNGDGMGGDCHPVPCAELSENNDGGWSYHKDKFTKEQVHLSQDRFCHVCIGHAYNGQDLPHCVFIHEGA